MIKYGLAVCLIAGAQQAHAMHLLKTRVMRNVNAVMSTLHGAVGKISPYAFSRAYSVKKSDAESENCDSKNLVCHCRETEKANFTCTKEEYEQWTKWDRAWYDQHILQREEDYVGAQRKVFQKLNDRIDEFKPEFRVGSGDVDRSAMVLCTVRKFLSAHIYDLCIKEKDLHQQKWRIINKVMDALVEESRQLHNASKNPETYTPIKDQKPNGEY